MKTAPYFAFYASDIMADKRYRSMCLDERGLLISLMSECWVNHSIPVDPDAIGKWLGFSGENVKAALTDHVLSFFRKEKSELICPEIEKYREKILAHRDKQSKGGKNGAIGRWGKPSGGDGLPNGLPNGLLDRKDMKRKGLSLEKGIAPIDDPWINDYENASRGT